jgi:hypothetical protein
MTPPEFRDGPGDLWPPADDVRLAEAVETLKDMAPVVDHARQSGTRWLSLPAADVIRLHDALSYTVARATQGCDGPGVIAFLLTVLLGVAGGVVLAALVIGGLCR